MEQRSTGSSPSRVVGLAGGLLAVLGSFLVWFTVKADTSKFPGGNILTKSVKGTEGSDGKVTLVAGIVVLLAAAALWMMTGGGRKALAVLGGLAGLVAGGLGLYDVFTAKTQIIDAAVKDVGSSAGVSSAQVRSFLEKFFDSGVLKVSPGIGIMLVIAGGVVAVVAALMGLMGGRRPSMAAAGFGGTPSMPESGWETAPPARPMPMPVAEPPPPPEPPPAEGPGEPEPPAPA